MFTGIVEELGSLRECYPDGGHTRLVFDATAVIEDTIVGASIAVNGCCLTVVELDASGWSADVVTETVARSTLGSLLPGEPVNLERPLRLSDHLGGHLVQGHVDGVGEVVAAAPALQVRVPADLTRYLVAKGSITVDGVSLTVAEVGPDWFAVAIIPHTAAVTTLGRRRPGDGVNLEVDVIAKYTEALLRGGVASPYLTSTTERGGRRAG